MRRSANAKPDYTALQLQTSVSILPIPIVWGQNKIAANVIWYANFKAVPGGNGKGIGGKGGLLGGGASASSYTYTADIMMALCEGPISGVGLVWKDLSVYFLAELGLAITTARRRKRSGLISPRSTPINALAYQGTAIRLAPATISATRRRSAITISRFLAS